MLNRWLPARLCSSFLAVNDPQLVATLRSRSPDTLTELLDVYGDRLFSYCWRLLRNRENAQIPVRDALAVTIAQIGRSACGEWLSLWLYSLARAECLTYQPTSPQRSPSPSDSSSPSPSPSPSSASASQSWS
jgi:DNA-directed RNA polymerase specialized sigma24 family protein